MLSFLLLSVVSSSIQSGVCNKVVYYSKFNYCEIVYSYSKCGYIFCGETDNWFVNSHATIWLGETKEQAIMSLTQIEAFHKTSESGEELIVNNSKCEAKTKIFKSLGTLVIEEDGVDGQSFSLWWMNFKRARKSIKNFKQ